MYFFCVYAFFFVTLRAFFELHIQNLYNMKHVIFILLVALGLSSCNTASQKPQVEANANTQNPIMPITFIGNPTLLSFQHTANAFLRLLHVRAIR